MAIAALERGIHVLCEKPLAISHAQLDALEAAVKKSKATLGVCHQNRYEPTMLQLKRMTEAGVRAGFATVVWKRDEKYYRSGAWRGTLDQEGGGVMINQALHTLDLMQWMCGYPKTVQAHISNDTHRGQIEVEDTATALFQTEGGTAFHFFATTSAAADFPPQLHFVLSSGERITAENHFLAVKGELLPVEQQGEVIGKTVWGDGHRMLIADFYRCIAQGNPFPIDFEQGSKVIRLILGMYQSGGEQIDIL
jgi:predicted dehydrogenase